MVDSNGWSEAELYVKEELKRISKSGETHSRDLTTFRLAMVVQLSDIKSEIAVLKTKAGVWGVIGGAIPVSVGLLIWWLQRLLQNAAGP